MAENGDFALDCWGEFIQLDPALGTAKHLYTAPDSNGVLCFANPTGLHRATEGSDTLEQLADDSLTSLSMPSIVRRQLLVLEDSCYLALCWSDRNWLLFSYAYDPDVPTLADLSARLETLSASGGLLDNIVEAYRQADRTLPAVPSQFQVPLLHGSDDAMGAIHDLSSMTDWLEANNSGYRSPSFSIRRKIISASSTLPVPRPWRAVSIRKSSLIFFLC